MDDLISIVVAIYNTEKYLSECIESIINQTYKNLEILLIDDGSNDDSLNICKQYEKKDNRIKVYSQENHGVSNVRNKGIENSTGKYITFIDSDDYISLDFIEKLYNTLKNEKVECVGCRFNRIYNDSTEPNLIRASYKITGNELYRKILNVQTATGFCHMKLYLKDVIEDIKFNEELKVGEDALFCMMASKKINNFYLLNEPLYNYRVNLESVVKKYDPNYVNKYYESMVLAKKYAGKEIQIYNYIMYHVLLIAVNYCFNPENKLKFNKQIEELKKVCNIELFKEAIQKSDYKELSITRKITLFTLKYKLYFLTMCICKFRQRKVRK